MSKRIWNAGALMAGMAVASGCTTALPPVAVTRFHNASPAMGGTIRLEPGAAADAPSLEYRAVANAVASNLGRAGFTIAGEGGTPDYRAIIAVARAVIRPDAPSRLPVSVGVGGSTGSYGSGLGVGIGIDLSGPARAQIVTTLSVQIRRTADGAAIWEGQAETRAREGTPASQPGIAAGKLAQALLQGYPGRSGETIVVR